MQKKLKILSWVMVFCLTLICFSVADFTVSAATENANIISGESYRLQNVGSGKYLNVKSGSDGRIFGTISTKQISEKLNELGYKIDKKQMKQDLPLNVLGTHYVKIALHKKVECELKVVLK